MLPLTENTAQIQEILRYKMTRHQKQNYSGNRTGKLFYNPSKRSYMCFYTLMKLDVVHIVFRWMYTYDALFLSVTLYFVIEEWLQVVPLSAKLYQTYPSCSCFQAPIHVA